jgi:alpha-L-fucosidase
VITGEAKWDKAAGTAMLTAQIVDMGKAASVEAGFEYRVVTGLDITERSNDWRSIGMEARTQVGAVTRQWKAKAGEVYEVRAVVKHPLLTVYGKEVRLTAR